MLTFFAPNGWRVGTDLKSANKTWDSVFLCTEFKPLHIKIMLNMNVLYECQNSRDDFSAQRKAVIRPHFYASILSYFRLPIFRFGLLHQF